MTILPQRNSRDYCLFCDDGCTSLHLANLPAHVTLRGVWENCENSPGVMHPVGASAVKQAEELTAIDWELVR